MKQLRSTSFDCARANALNVRVTFFYATSQNYSVFQTPDIVVGPMQTLSFTVTNWQTLNNTSPQPVTWTIKASAPSVPVGGEWNPIMLQALSPMNTLQLLFPWISSGMLTLAIVAPFVYVKRRKKKQE
jgi:hypothetical protein